MFISYGTILCHSPGKALAINQVSTSVSVDNPVKKPTERRCTLLVVSLEQEVELHQPFKSTISQAARLHRGGAVTTAPAGKNIPNRLQACTLADNQSF